MVKRKRVAAAATSSTATPSSSGDQGAGGAGSVADLILKATGTEPASEAKKDAGKSGLADRFSKLFAEGAGSSGSLLFGSSSSGASSSSSAGAAPKAARSSTAKPADAGASVDSGTGQDAAGTSSSSAAPNPKKRKMSQEEMKEREARTLFLGNVPISWDEKKLRRTLREAVGDKYTGQFKPLWFRAIPLEGKWNWTDKMRKAGSIQKAYTEDADSKNAYVVLTSPEDVPVVSRAVNNFQADQSHRLRADGVGSSAVMKKFDRKRSVFLGNLPARCTEADIRGVMAPAGEVDAVRVVRDKHTKECQGFAFVRFAERRSVKEALNLWGAELHGRWIRVMKVEDESSPDSKSREQDGSMHPATRRIQLRQQQRQRQKAAKQKAFVKDARDAGLRTGKKKSGKSNRVKGAKGGKKKKAGRR